MDNEKDMKPADDNLKVVKKRWLFKNVKGWKRLFLMSGVYLFTFTVLFAIAAEYTSRPSFCPTCHYMESFYQSWKTSEHNKVDCVECHFEPGLTGTIKGKLNGLVQIVSYVSLTYKKRKPVAEIPDNTCARSGCHEKQSLSDTTYDFKGISFSHKDHLNEQKRGKDLKCVSCHSQIVQGTHMEVTESTCNNCHFKKSDDPEHKFDKLSDCSTCHKFNEKSKEELVNLRYNHSSVVENKIDCKSCHNNTVSGNGAVGKERCFQCHFEEDRLGKYNDIELIHSTHISKHSLDCANCHSPIEHKIQQMDPNASPDCNSCHENAHLSQVSLVSGQNGFDVEKSPSSMFMSGINCKGCHIFHEVDKNDINTSKAKGSACEKCHGPGYENLLKEWETTSMKRLGIIKTIYNAVNPQIQNSTSSNKAEAQKYMNEANHNLRMVEIGKSVHNVQFADKLLVASYGLMKKALSVVGSSKSLPEFKSSSEVIPNECYRCHSGIQEISVNKYGMNFSHNEHIVKNKVACARCHSNVSKHGELTMSKESCNSCHHSKNKNEESCENCHSFQSSVYNGTYLKRDQPDFMKVGGSKCIDCHVSSDKVIKPDATICSKCHDADYDAMMGDWKKEVVKLSAEVNELIKGINVSELDQEQQNELKEIRKIYSEINSHKSIYVHNYDLISSVLTEKKKKLKAMSE